MKTLQSIAEQALAEDGYGWEKLFSERMCRHFREDFALTTRVARYHNVYGPFGTYQGDREKAPAAMCRKVIEAQQSDHHDIEEPINLGSSEMVTINELVDIVEEIAGVKLERVESQGRPG